MCTSFFIKAEDGSPIYGRTMEWGAFDLHSDLALVPRNMTVSSDLGGGKQGMRWTNRFGYVAINAVKKPFVTDGMNETGLTLGGLYFPGFAEYQSLESGSEASTLNNVDLSAYILGQFHNVEELKASLPGLRVVYNEDLAEEFGAPAPLHLIVVDDAGQSVVIEYVRGELNIYDNSIGVLTNSPSYDWHILNLRNYPQLRAYGGGHDREANGINLAPFGAGAGMRGLPGDVTPPSRFVRAVAYTQTLITPKDADEGVNETARILNNFDISRGMVREGESPEDFVLSVTQWSTIGDIRNRRYFWWTEHNRRMRMVDLNRLDFEATQIKTIPLDEVRVQDVDDRTSGFEASE